MVSLKVVSDDLNYHIKGRTILLNFFLVLKTGSKLSLPIAALIIKITALLI